MSIEYRPILEGELPEATQVYFDTVQDMLTRNGISTVQPTAFDDRLEEYRHIFATGIFHVAREDGKIVAIANGIVRDEQWFLSGYWTRPEFQNRGIGHPLLQKVWAEAMTLNPPIAFTWSSIDLTAMATYLKHGLAPLTSIMRFKGKPQAPIPVAPAGYTFKPIRTETIGKLEQEVRGTRREVEHHFFGHLYNAGFQVMRGPVCVGYFYADHGTIGPAAWSADEHADAVLRLALKTGLAQNEEIQFIGLGVNKKAIELALSLRLSLIANTQLFANRPFGALERYLPSGPALF